MPNRNVILLQFYTFQLNVLLILRPLTKILHCNISSETINWNLLQKDVDDQLNSLTIDRLNERSLVANYASNLTGLKLRSRRSTERDRDRYLNGRICVLDDVPIAWGKLKTTCNSSTVKTEQITNW